eukprot:738748-Rhodomonas_salina.1
MSLRSGALMVLDDDRVHRAPNFPRSSSSDRSSCAPPSSEFEGVEGGREEEGGGERREERGGPLRRGNASCTGVYVSVHTGVRQRAHERAGGGPDLGSCWHGPTAPRPPPSRPSTPARGREGGEGGGGRKEEEEEGGGVGVGVGVGGGERKVKVQERVCSCFLVCSALLCSALSLHLPFTPLSPITIPPSSSFSSPSLGYLDGAVQVACAPFCWTPLLSSPLLSSPLSLFSLSPTPTLISLSSIPPSSSSSSSYLDGAMQELEPALLLDPRDLIAQARGQPRLR